MTKVVAVLGADSPIGLTVVRELGRAGLEVIAHGRSARALGRFSRFAARSLVETRPLAAWLPGFAAENRLAAVIAISEGQLVELAALKGKLGTCEVLCPDPAQLDLVLDKTRTLEFASRLGMDVPASWQPLAGEDHSARAAALDYPVAIKWADPGAVSHLLAAAGLALEKVEYAGDAAALLAILGRYDRLGVWPLVQRYCPGVGLGQMLFMHRGKATLRFQHQRLREYPPSGGVSSFCAALPLADHGAQMAVSEALLQALDWEGPAMVEYRYDAPSRRYFLMEVNGRFWGSLALASHCGALFAREQAVCAGLLPRGDSIPPLKLRRARYVIPDCKHIAIVLRDASLPLGQRLRRLARFCADFLDPRVRYYVWSLADPGPFFGDLGAIISRLWRRETPRQGG